MKYVIGKKIGMMQVFDPDKKTAKAVTLIDVAPMKVTKMKVRETDGYRAAQFGYGAKKRMAKPQATELKDFGSFQGLREMRLAESESLERGAVIGIEQFATGDSVSVSGVTKGRGFAGAVKRHGFAGGPRSHGQKHAEREPGSIGGGARAGGRVRKGLRMAGHMGNVRVTVRNLVVADVDQNANVISLYGAVPGPNGAWIEIKAR